MNQHIIDEIERAERTLEIFNRVHSELEDGKAWKDIDNGLRETQGYKYSYQAWYAYMDSRCRSILQSIVLTYRHDLNGQCAPPAKDGL